MSCFALIFLRSRSVPGGALASHSILRIDVTLNVTLLPARASPSVPAIDSLRHLGFEVTSPSLVRASLCQEVFRGLSHEWPVAYDHRIVSIGGPSRERSSGLHLIVAAASPPPLRVVKKRQNAGSVLGRVAVPCAIMRGYPLAPLAGGSMAQGLRQSAAYPSWRPAARIFTGQGLRDASRQRPFLTWDVTVRGST
jgi:hypothetical protein